MNDYLSESEFILLSAKEQAEKLNSAILPDLRKKIFEKIRNPKISPGKIYSTEMMVFDNSKKEYLELIKKELEDKGYTVELKNTCDFYPKQYEKDHNCYFCKSHFTVSFPMFPG